MAPKVHVCKYILYIYTQMYSQGHHDLFFCNMSHCSLSSEKAWIKIYGFMPSSSKTQQVQGMFCISNSSDHQDRTTACSNAPGSLESHGAKTRFQEVREMFSKLAVTQIFHLSA